MIVSGLLARRKSPPDREFLALETLRLNQKWLEGSIGPVETMIAADGEKLPDVDELNAKCPDDEWSEKFGQRRGPWQEAQVLYLLNQKTMEVLSFVSSTVGGARAIRELKDRTKMARRLKGPGVFPVVTLGDTHMPTRFGGRQRPYFEVKGFVPVGDPSTPIGGPAAPKQITHAEQKEELDDPLPEMWLPDDDGKKQRVSKKK